MTKQQEKVYRTILANPGITSKEIMLMTGIQCPSGRISELREMGVKIGSMGHKKFPGSKPFEMYAIDTPHTKKVMRVDIVDNVAIPRWEEVPI